MNNKGYIAAIVVVVILVAGGLIYWYSSMQAPSYSPPPTYQAPTTTPVAPTPTTTPSSTPPAATTTAPANATTSATAKPAPHSFTVHGNDTSADLTTITVPKGTPVAITFAVDAQGTYHGGLDFRSSVVSTGAIAPGSSKIVNFTANSSFVFTPYWPATNIKKPYVISVVVQ